MSERANKSESQESEQSLFAWRAEEERWESEERVARRARSALEIEGQELKRKASIQSLIANLAWALTGAFDQERAIEAERAILESVGGDPRRMIALMRSSWDDAVWDPGQASNAYAKDKASPLVSLCRWGSQEGFQWWASRPWASPVERCKRAADFWGFELAAKNGKTEAVEPLMRAGVENDGWGPAEIRVALASWTAGLAMMSFKESMSLERFKAGLRAAEPWLGKLPKDQKLTLSPSGVFVCAPSALIARDELEAPGREMALRALMEWGGDRFEHETQVKDSELWELAQSKPNEARTFMEDAIVCGQIGCARVLRDLGHPLPDPTRLEQLDRDERNQEAMSWARGELAALEAQELEAQAQPGRPREPKRGL